MIREFFRSISLLILLLTCVSTGYGQAKFVSYNTLNPNNGLSHITVNSLYQDSNDAIWIATRDGLNCYDGSAVKLFRKDKNNPKSLASSNIGQIEGDTQGRLFLSCNDGVWMMNIATEEFTLIYDIKINRVMWNSDLYLASDNQILIWNEPKSHFSPYFTHPDSSVEISTMMFDDRGQLWIGTTDRGVYVRDSSGQLRHSLPHGGVLDMVIGESGEVWVATSDEGLYMIDSFDREVTQFSHDEGDSNSLPSNFVRDILFDDVGDLWIATNRGIARHTPRSNRFERYHTAENSSSVWTILNDRQGNIWFGSYFGGVNWFNPQDNIFSRYNMIDTYRNSLEGTVIGRMVEDREGVIWICTEGSSVYLYDRSTGLFTPLVDSRGNAAVGENIKSIYYDKRRNIMWFGSHLEGLYRYDIASGAVRNYRYDPKQRWSLPSNIIRDIVAYDDKLILATPTGVVEFDPSTGRSERMFIDTPEGRRISPVANLLVDSGSTLWIGTEGVGLFTYNFGDGTLVHYDSRRTGDISGNNISTIIEDHQGSIWIGHEGAGIDRFDPETSIFTNLDTRSAGIVGNRIYEICDNLDGTLSISAGEGLSLLNIESHQSYNYSPKSGYTLLSPNENAMFRSNDGELFIGGVDGLISLDLENLRNIKHRDYKLRFTTLYVNQNLIAPNDQTEILDQILPNLTQVVLPSSTTSFSVGFTTSNYILEINEPLEFRLDGFDREWMATRGNQITYTNIPAGSYTLQLRAASGAESVEAAALQIIISSVWYKSAWAYMLYTIIFLILAYYLNLLYRQRVRLSEQVKYEQNRVQSIEDQNRSKLQFFTNISHEFRTPLAVIIGQIELLLKSKQVGGESRSRVQSIYRSSNELNLLISELLDFRKHEQGRLSLNIKQANVSEMLQELHDIYCDHIASRGVAIKLTMPDEGEAVLLNCDIMQLRKVVTNLLSNAIKYTTKGDLISISLAQTPSSVEIRVEDSGAGIPTADMQHIFDRFYQGINSQSSMIGGTGIGLSFAKSIVELHGGVISVDSRLGSGAWFKVSIPRDLEASTTKTVKAVEVERATKYAEEVVEPSLLLGGVKRKNRVSILIVEDDPQLLKMLVDIFSGQYSVITAINGREGIDVAREQQPQIIVSDIMMPEVSGIELCRTLKADLQTSHIPIVLLTARGATEHAVEGINCGADDYIIKPFNVELLLARCNNIINNRVLLQEKYSKQPEDNTYKMATSQLDQRVLERAVEIIDKHIDNPDFDIATFSSEIAMSRTNLFAKIKAVTGLTPNDFILTIRLKRAAAILRSEPLLPIVEVSERVGFNGQRYFSKRFKERFGVTPAAYRQRQSEGE